MLTSILVAALGLALGAGVALWFRAEAVRAAADAKLATAAHDEVERRLLDAEEAVAASEARRHEVEARASEVVHLARAQLAREREVVHAVVESSPVTSAAPVADALDALGARLSEDPGPARDPDAGRDPAVPARGPAGGPGVGHGEG